MSDSSSNETSLEARLKDCEGRLRIAMYGITDHAIIQTDLNGDILDWNAGAEKLIGFAKSEILGERASVIFSPEDKELGVHLDEMETARKTGRAEDNRWHVRKDGSLFFATGVMNLLRDEQGEEMGFVKVLRDSTEVKQAQDALERSEARYRLATKATRNIIWDWDLIAGEVVWNRALITELGYSEEDLMTSEEWWLEHLHPEDRPAVEGSIHQQIESNTDSWISEYRFQAADGSYRTFRDRGYLLFGADGNATRMVGGMEDVTQEKRFREQLERAKEKAEIANASKTAFLANMSHEIRTPMTAVLGFTDVLKERDLSEAERNDALMRIENSGRALLRLIEDILDISKIEAGKLEIVPVPFSPAGIVSEVISLLRLTAEKKKVSLRLKIDPAVPTIATSDPARVRQVLVNLIGNAVKFTEKGEVVVRLKTEDGETLAFEIVDTGIGISKEEQAKLFQPFAQADESITRKFGGTGLGLMLSRRLVESMGGELKLVESVKGEGSSFLVKIPASPFSQEGTAHHEEIPIDSARFDGHAEPEDLLLGLRILVAEDVADNRVLLRRYLEGAGAKVDFAENGHEAIERAQKTVYSLILMNIQMPHIDGIQAVETLRRDGYQGPIVALTAHAMAEEVERSLAAGCEAHLTKPVARNHLVKAVKDYAK